MPAEPDEKAEIDCDVVAERLISRPPMTVDGATEALRIALERERFLGRRWNESSEVQSRLLDELREAATARYEAEGELSRALIGDGS